VVKSAAPMKKKIGVKKVKFDEVLSALLKSNPIGFGKLNGSGKRGSKKVR
jgi:hypothetical protein